MMQHQQQQVPSYSRVRRRSQQRSDFTPGLLTTALTVSTVLILLAATFLADWLHTPDLTVTSSNTAISPNGDRDHDTVTVSYNLSEEATITIRALAEGGGVVRTLTEKEKQPAGQHFISWDGRNDLNSPVADGFYKLEVTAQGSVRATSQSVQFLVDTRPPDLQLANLPNGMRVGANPLEVQGLTDPDAIIWLSGDPQPLVVDGQGRFFFQRNLVEGDNLFEVRAVDQAGNTTRIARQVTLVTAPPDVIITRPLEDEWTNQPLVKLAGQAPIGASLTANGQKVIVSENGYFEHELLLDEGTNIIRLEATDDVGNITTVERAIHVKTRPPGIELNVPDGANVSDAHLQLTGRTDPGATVVVNGKIIPVSALGDFQANLNLSPGDNTVRIEAHDQAGNLTRLNRLVRYATATPASGFDRLLRNLGELPNLTFPLVLAVGVIAALLLLRQNQVSLVLSVDQNQFTPEQPSLSGEEKTLALSLDLNKPARVTLEVLDAYGDPVATILRNRRRSARIHLFQWDGYDDFGQPVQPGEYTIQATAGAPPIKVTSAVQVLITAAPYTPNYSGERQVRRTPSVRRDR